MVNYYAYHVNSAVDHIISQAVLPKSVKRSFL